VFYLKNKVLNFTLAPPCGIYNLLALRNSRNEAVKMIIERGTSECLSILGVMK